MRYPDFRAVGDEGKIRTKEKTGPLKHGKWNALRTYGPKAEGIKTGVFMYVRVLLNQIGRKDEGWGREGAKGYNLLYTRVKFTE